MSNANKFENKMLLNSTSYDEVFQVYQYRYLIVAIFILAGFANALVLLTWSPIADVANTYWDDIGLSYVNLLAVSFQISYIPGTILALYISKRSNLKGILLGGGTLTTVGCGIRWIGAYSYEKSNSNLSAGGSYAIILVGTFFVALSQPFYLNLPAKIGAAWFSVKERDISTTVCSLANPLGSALGSLIPAFFVSGGGVNEDDDKPVAGVANLLLIQLLIALSGLVVVILFFRSEPPTPPSKSESKKSDLQNTEKSQATEFFILLKNTEYLKLLISFTIVLGNLNALAALLAQLPGDYTNDQIGITGFALILSGFLGAFICGLVLEKTKQYRPIIKISWVSAVFCWILFMGSCRANSFPFFIVSGAILGFALLPIIPATIMNSVECAYPVPEDLALGLLYIGANTFAVALTFIGQVFLALPDDSAGPAPLFAFAIWSIGLMLIGLIPVLLYNGKYLRLDQDLTTSLTAVNTDESA